LKQLHVAPADKSQMDDGLTTNNVTAVTEVQTASFRLLTECHHYNASHVAIFLSSSVVSHTVCAMRVRIRSLGIILIQCFR